MTPAKKKLLVIDNDPASTRTVRQTLERRPAFAVCGLNDPTSAVRVAREFRPDRVPLDVETPAMAGGEVARGIQADATLRAPPVIPVTGSVTGAETAGVSKDTNGLRVLARPVTMAGLVRGLTERPGVLRAVERDTAVMPAVPE